MGSSFRAETLKLRKRPATWVLALIWVVIIAFSYFSTYAFIANAPPPGPPPGAGPNGEEMPPEVQEQMQTQEQAFNDAILQSLYPENLVSNLLTGGLPISARRCCSSWGPWPWGASMDGALSRPR